MPTTLLLGTRVFKIGTQAPTHFGSIPSYVESLQMQSIRFLIFAICALLKGLQLSILRNFFNNSLANQFKTFTSIYFFFTFPKITNKLFPKL